MALLDEYAITPDVFESTTYTPPELGDLYLQTLKAVVMDEAIVRNLCDGEWVKALKTERPWHPRRKELLKKLANKNRLRKFAACLHTPASTDLEWAEEAVATYGTTPFTGVIASPSVASAHPPNPLVLRHN